MQEQLKQSLKSGTEALDKIRYWAELAQSELNCFEDIEKAIYQVVALDNVGLLHIKEIEDKGVVAFLIMDDFRGHKICSELFIYVKPEYRGGFKTIIKIIEIMERSAKEHLCKFVTIGSNIGYKDSKFLHLLSRFGYQPDTVKKEI